MDQTWVPSNPDVRFSAFSKTLRFPNTPDFRQRLITGQYCPVIGRPVHSNSNLRLSDVRFQLLPTGRLIAETGSKPVWDRFLDVRTGFGTGFRRLSENRTLYPVFRRFGTKTGSKPVLVDSDVISGFQTLYIYIYAVSRRKLDVRFGKPDEKASGF